MIGLQARRSLDRMLEHGLRNALEDPGTRAVDIAPCDGFNPGRGARLVLLMIASHGFRVVIAIAFPDTPPTHALLAALGRLPDAEDPAAAFHDAIAETGNMCCGTLNRELGRFHTHTGMSTPYVIDSGSAPHVAGLRHGYSRNLRIGIGGGTWLHASLTVDAHEPMDFDWAPEPSPETAGELELF